MSLDITHARNDAIRGKMSEILRRNKKRRRAVITPLTKALITGNRSFGRREVFRRFVALLLATRSTTAKENAHNAKTQKPNPNTTIRTFV